MTRRVRVRALAKLNLDLRVMHRRADGYHELRTIFHTISLADRLAIEFTAARRTELTLGGNQDIPDHDNLVLRACRAALDEMRMPARVHFRLEKRIPIGAGLGGGSSDAAAVLLTLPVLAGKVIPTARLIALGHDLGSDVPFFLLGGAAVGLGRGTELYPLPDLPRRWGVLAAPGIHVSTPDAYRALARPAELTSPAAKLTIEGFQALTWDQDLANGVNDFEPAVFSRHPELAVWRRRLARAGATPARMSGSGSSLFGLFRTRAEAERARESFGEEPVLPFMLVSRTRYRGLWKRALAPFISDHPWPPRSRYVR